MANRDYNRGYSPAIGTTSGRVMLLAVLGLGLALMVMVCRSEVGVVAEGVACSIPVGEGGRNGEENKQELLTCFITYVNE